MLVLMVLPLIMFLSLKIKLALKVACYVQCYVQLDGGHWSAAQWALQLQFSSDITTFLSS